MATLDSAVALVAPYCDIVERLELIPPSAQVRGVFFRNIETQLAKHGQLDAYRTYFPHDAYATNAFHYVGDYLVHLACAGALIASPPQVHEGISLIAKGNARTFVESLLGRMMLRKLSANPVKLMEQGLAARRQSFTYGRWDIVLHGDRAFEIVHRHEYVWIESDVAGAARGTFEPLGITDIETKLIDRFNGSTFIRW